jgi:para-aminobenzoate synthetase/4-amino-4-deoxychorismate lyase
MSVETERVEAVVLDEAGWLHFTRPSRIVEARRPLDVAPAIATIERLTRDSRCHAVGFVTYEAGAAFGLRVHQPPEDLPLAWFAVFDDGPVRIEHLSDWSRNVAPAYELGAMTPTVDRPRFNEAFERIKRHIADGETYQANYTFRIEGSFTGDVRQLFADLAGSQRGRYAAFIRLGDLVICSGSPELFFSRAGSRLTARPMKGTAGRGRTLVEDVERRDTLRASPKERAENVMIVDMVRNDVGRVAAFGTVSVPELLTVEKYPTVWQMTSTVTADTSAGLDEIFAALHPSASVTGAPKVNTMKILNDLEAGPRGIYTGAIGYLTPGGDATFNVAIRTAVVDERRGFLSFGIGSGIVWDSNPAGEYDECLLKAAVLGRTPAQFDLLETLRWTPAGGFFLLERHLRRLQDSAEYFGFPYGADGVVEALSEAIRGADRPLRVRLTMTARGGLRVEQAPLEPNAAPVRVALAVDPVDPADVLLYHKTTARHVYDRARLPGVDDVILWNPQGQVTEATIFNLVVELDGVLVTPPVACGLLAGTFRAELLYRGEIREAVVTIDDLRRASRLWLINSVQEWRPGTLVERGRIA